MCGCLLERNVCRNKKKERERERVASLSHFASMCVSVDGWSCLRIIPSLLSFLPLGSLPHPSIHSILQGEGGGRRGGRGRGLPMYCTSGVRNTACLLRILISHVPNRMKLTYYVQCFQTIRKFRLSLLGSPVFFAFP